jgi:type II secretory pathway pseudopilin PulG
MQAVILVVAVLTIVASALVYALRPRTAIEKKKRRMIQEEVNLYTNLEERIRQNNELSTDEKAFLLTRAAKNYGMPRIFETKMPYTQRLAHKYATLSARKSRK